MEIKLTKEQQLAVNSRGSRLIVSAAAGSGKTAVLVRRVIELLCDPVRPRRISDFIIVTFTNAAASEMRSKIADAIRVRLAGEPGNAHLRRQLALLPGARVQTVHAFCQDLIRQNFVQCGVAADFKLMDEEEALRLRDEVLDRVLESEYAEDRPDFRRLCDAMRENRGDARLVKTITTVYQKVMSMPDPERWLTESAQQMTAGTPEETRWGRRALQCTREQIGRMAEDLHAAEMLLETGGDELEGWRKLFEALALQISELAEGQDRDWDWLRGKVRTFAFPTAPRKKIDPVLKAELTGCRDRIKDRIEYIRKKILITDSASAIEEQREQAGLVAELCRLVIRLIRETGQEKRRCNQLDYNDLEHLAYGLLTGEDGGPSQLAQQISGQLEELMVDEYQDTNDIQDAIFDRIAPRKGGMFLVGDLKQSIYRFRMAEPAIFLRKYKESVPLDPDMHQERVRLALNNNFRSSEQVVEFCNFVFDRLMSERFGGIDYDENERLHAAGKKPAGEMPCEAWLLEKGAGGEDDEKSAETEARFVAARISEMLRDTLVDDGNNGRRPVRPEDFAILLSSFSNKEPYYTTELRKLGIPVSSASGGDFWNSPEILTVLSFLRVIDNRRQDVPLIGLMRSPVYFFSEEELARVRLYRRMLDYIDAVELAAPDMPKAAALLQDLERYASFACDMSVSQLLRLIYEEKNIPAIFAAMENGAARRENLELLLGMAVRFERSAARGLYRFIQYVDRMILKGNQPERLGNEGGVQLMSIHKSKGLEFPIVFLPDLNKGFNEDDCKEPVLIHKEEGIAMKLRIPQLHAEFTPQIYVSTANRIREEGRAEELRKLYVAMTRAKERLIVSAVVSNPETYLKNQAEKLPGREFDPLFVSECSRMSDWVFGALLEHPGAGAFRVLCQRELRQMPGLAEHLRCRILSSGEEIKAPVYKAEAAEQAEHYGLKDPWKLLRMMDMEYAHKAVCGLPSKLTPTGAKRLMPEAAELYRGADGSAIRLYHASEETKGSAADRGSANHLALSVLPLEQCTTETGLHEQLAAVQQSGRIPEETLSLVDPKLLLKFTAGPLGARTLAASRYLREYEFGVLLPPEKLLGGLETGEQILVNGVIDLLLFEPDGITIIDFKTDRVKSGEAAAAAEKHRFQLEIYAQAAAEIFGLPVRDRIVFFLRTGEWALV